VVHGRLSGISRMILFIVIYLWSVRSTLIQSSLISHLEVHVTLWLAMDLQWPISTLTSPSPALPVQVSTMRNPNHPPLHNADILDPWFISGFLFFSSVLHPSGSTLTSLSSLTLLWITGMLPISWWSTYVAYLTTFREFLRWMCWGNSCSHNNSWIASSLKQWLWATRRRN